MAEPILIAKNGATECLLLPQLANRHGLITGATGTGKTVTLQTLAENFSKIGVPVRSPLTSAMNTGTPMRDKFSAIVCSVTVLPVPVAPVIRPCRLASCGSRKHSVAPLFAISIGSAIERSLSGEKVKSLPRLNQDKGGASWLDTANGPISNTAKGARTRSAARCGPA